MNDVLRGLLLQTGLRWELRSIILVRQALYTLNHTVYRLALSRAYLHFSTVLLLNHKAIRTSFIVKKVFGKEFGGRNRGRLPPFILCRCNSVSHAFILDLVSYSSSWFITYSLASLVMTLLITHIRERRVTRCKPCGLLALRCLVIVLKHSLLSLVKRLWNYRVHMVLFITDCEIDTCSSLVRLLFCHFIQESLERTLTSLLTALEGYDAAMWLWRDICRLSFLETRSFNRFDRKSKTT